MAVIRTHYTSDWFSGLLSPYHWASPLSYSVPSESAYFSQEYNQSGEWQNWYALTLQQRTAFHTLVEHVNNLTNLGLQEVADTSSYGDIRIAFTDIASSDTSAYAYLPTPYYVNGAEASDLAGDIWLSEYLWSDEAKSGGWLNHTMMHELGHALGLLHPFESNPHFSDSLPQYDNYQFTVMSYTDHPDMPGTVPVSFQLMDIAALQYMYGANLAYNNDDTHYTFEPIIPLQTLWDGGGSDTLDFSAVNTHVTADLSPGGFISAGESATLHGNAVPGINNLAIAFGTDIEHFIGSSYGNDVLGNALDNHVVLGAGNDTFHWSGGSDTLLFGAGEDWLVLPHEYAQWSLELSQGLDINHLRLTNHQTADSLTFRAVEHVQFDDVTFTPAQLVFSLPGDATLVSGDTAWQSSIYTGEDTLIPPTSAQLYRLYLGTLGRTPDQPGFEWWLNHTFNESSLETTARGFYYSTEFQARTDTDNNGEISHEELLNQLYTNVLGRTPDPDGYNWWLNELYSGDYLPQQVVVGFTQSDEYVHATLQIVGLQIWLT